MLAVFFIYVIMVLYKSNITLKGTADYLSIENTTSVKGIFIIMVFLSHFNGYVDLNGKTDGIYKTVIGVIGQAMVAMFMFYSGYGIMESVKKKGDSYVSQMPLKRILATLFKFDCAIVLYVVLRFALSTPLKAKQVLLSLVGWESIGNSNWYIFVILSLYFIAYISFKICRTENLLFSAFFMTAVTFAFIFIMYKLKPAYWYDTVLCFMIGMFYSLWKEYFVKVINYNVITWAVILIFSFSAFYISRKIGSVFHISANIFFTIGFVVLTMRVTFNNKLLKWCGNHLFEIYILQRIPMILFGRVEWIRSNEYFYFVICLSLTVILTIGFKCITDLAWKKLTFKRI